MSLTRPNPFTRPSPFRPSEQSNFSSSPYSQKARIIQSQVKPIYEGFTILPKGPAFINDYTPSPTNLNPSTRSYQGISNDVNKNSYINSMIPTSDNIYAQQKNSYSYTSNLNMNSNYSLLQVNNPLNKQNPFNRTSLLGFSKDNGMSGFGQEDYKNSHRLSSNYSNSYENANGFEKNYNYDHLLYKPSGESIANKFQLERIDSSNKLSKKGIDYYKYESEGSPNKYGKNATTHVNLNTNYINTDKSDTASVRSYINKINELEDPKQEYEDYYSNSPTMSNPFNRKSLCPAIGFNATVTQNKSRFEYNTEKYGDYGHLQYKSSMGEVEKKKYNKNDEQICYPASFDKYRYKYEKQKQNQKKSDGENKIYAHHEESNSYAPDSYYDQRAHDNYETTNEKQKLGHYQHKQYEEKMQKQRYRDNKPATMKKQTRKLYEFEDYNQHQGNYQLSDEGDIYKYKNPYENPESKSGMNKEIVQKSKQGRWINDDLQKKYNFQRKDSYQYELQRMAPNQKVNIEEQFNTNYANNFNRQHEPHSQLQLRNIGQPGNISQYQSPQFGTISLNNKADNYPSLSKYENMPNDRNSHKDIVRFDDNQQQQSQGFYEKDVRGDNWKNENRKEDKYSKKEVQIPTNDPRQRQRGQYSSNILFRNQQFYRLQLV